MSEQPLSSEERFHRIVPLSFPAGADDFVTVAEIFATTDKHMTIYEADLTVEEARVLRDWLNKVLP